MTKTINIDESLHKKVAKYCREKGQKIVFFVGEAVREKIEKDDRIKSTEGGGIHYDNL